MSDLLQVLSDRDATPWTGLVGFTPDEVVREAQEANHADLLLRAGTRTAVVEVKLGHLLSRDQQGRYEELGPDVDLYLAALESDELRLATHSQRWTFVGLSDLINRWDDSTDNLARLLSSELTRVLSGWDQEVSGVFEPSSSRQVAVGKLQQKFLARVVSRRIAHSLEARGRMASAGVSSGGGLPLVQAWTPVANDTNRCLMAEVRWWESKPGGEIRFGVDFYPEPDRPEDEQIRRAAYDLARSMDSVITYEGLNTFLQAERPDLAEVLTRVRSSRPKGKGDWDRVVTHGFAGSPLADGRKNNRRVTKPDFYGDGALRYQAIAEIDFGRATGLDLVELIDATLIYLKGGGSASGG